MTQFPASGRVNKTPITPRNTVAAARWRAENTVRRKGVWMEYANLAGLAEEMLADAYELVLSGWCQGASATDEFRRPTEPASAFARRWSAPGALTRVWQRCSDPFGPALEAFQTANLALAAVVHAVPQEWNDAEDRTQWQVLDAIALAAHEVSPAGKRVLTASNA